MFQSWLVKNREYRRQFDPQQVAREKTQEERRRESQKAVSRSMREKARSVRREFLSGLMTASYPHMAA
jgi:hypothetical protein